MCSKKVNINLSVKADEPGTGEINYRKVLRHLEESGYQGLVGYELFPLTDTQHAVQAIMEHC